MDPVSPHLGGDDTLQSALASLPDLSVIVLDTEMHIRALHGTALQRHGYVHERMIGQTLREVMPRGLWQRLEPLCARALAGETITFEQAALDGKAVYASTLRPVVRDGQVLGATMTSRDITTQRAAEEELAHVGGRLQEIAGENERTTRELDAARALFETTFASAPIGMLLGRALDDGSVEVVRCNPAFAAMLGREPEELLGAGAASVHPDDLGARRRMLDDVLAGRQVSGDLRYTHRDGNDICARTVPSLVHGSEGERLILIQVVDVSECKRLELQIREIADRDALTGLFSRRRFQEELEREVSRARRHGRPGALLVLDLDGFREVNDSLGHAAGDELLTRVGEALAFDPARQRRAGTHRGRRVRAHPARHRRGGGSRRRREAHRRGSRARIRQQRCTPGHRHGLDRHHPGHRWPGARCRQAADRIRHRDVPRQGIRQEPDRVLRGLRRRRKLLELVSRVP